MGTVISVVSEPTAVAAETPEGRTRSCTSAEPTETVKPNPVNKTE